MKAAFVLCLFLSLPCTAGAAEEGTVLVDDQTFEDFRKGAMDGAGLYAGRDGSLRWVNWFDLDRDGWSEILVNNDHNHFETPDAFIYQADSRGKFGSLYSPLRDEMPLYQLLEQADSAGNRLSRVPSLGGGRTHVADLNGDRWPDLVFCNFIHGWSEAPFPTCVYWGGPMGYSADRRSLFDAFRGVASASADLNRDGLVDLIVANAGREYHANKTTASGKEDPLDDKEGSSYIFPQDETGFSNTRRNAIATRFAIDVRAADFDRNGFPDIAFLEAGKPGRVRIYFNGPDGLAKRPVVLPVMAPTWGKISREFLTADFDGDGWIDIFAPSEGGTSEIFWNGPEGFSAELRTELPTSNAYSADCADVDRDGFADLVVANYSVRNEAEKSTKYEVDSVIFQGDNKRFATGRVAKLPTQGATGVRAVDVDDDGLTDIVFSQHRDEDTFDIPSVIYMNSKSGFFPGNRQFLGTFGAADVEAVPLTPGALVFSNRQSGFARYTGNSDATGGGQATDSLPRMGIFWGSPPAIYGPGAMTLLPSAAPETTFVCADIDADGFGDLVYLRGKADELRVRFGKMAGFASDRTLAIPVGFRGKSLTAADFNRDGFLDIVVTGLESPEMALFSGTDGGFSQAKSFPLRASTQSVACGDVNGDGYLDLAIVGKGAIQIVPGHPDKGFDTDRTVAIETGMFSSRVCLADFDDNGQLDLFVQNFSDARTDSNAVPSWVLFNDRGGFSLGRKTEIPSFGATGGSVADVNADGKLDLVVSNYHGATSRHVSVFVYYGDGGGKFRTDPERLPAYSSSGNLVLDLNNDGFRDIVVFNHSESTQQFGNGLMGGVHGTGSFIYWGAADGFDAERRSWLASFGPHARVNADPGNVRNRSSTETYISEKKSLKDYAGPSNISITADIVPPQSLRCEVQFDEGVWTSVPLKHDSGSVWTAGLEIPKSSVLRYKLILDSGNLGTGPIVRSVSIKSDNP
jgi:hypothetical protein